MLRVRALQSGYGQSQVLFGVDLDIAAGEEVIHKIGVSALQGTRLDTLLRHLGADTLVLCGAFTHMVVDSTARQAFDSGYAVVIASDACCAPAVGLHDNALATSLPNFALVMSSAQVIATFMAAS